MQAKTCTAILRDSSAAVPMASDTLYVCSWNASWWSLQVLTGICEGHKALKCRTTPPVAGMGMLYIPHCMLAVCMADAQDHLCQQLGQRTCRQLFCRRWPGLVLLCCLHFLVGLGSWQLGYSCGVDGRSLPCRCLNEFMHGCLIISEVSMDCAASWCNLASASLIV